ncbi:hypothetical protein KHP62_01155 [Rhodobacteraceae bacterium NNCM2]|nr:hypothetical protein [Coraliihabitans acroporae]
MPDSRPTGETGEHEAETPLETVPNPIGEREIPKTSIRAIAAWIGILLIAAVLLLMNYD